MYNIDENHVTKLDVENGYPSLRMNSAICIDYIRDKLILYAGESTKTKTMDDMHYISVKSIIYGREALKWVDVTSKNNPDPISNHIAFSWNMKVYSFGGCVNNIFYSNTLYEYIYDVDHYITRLIRGYLILNNFLGAHVQNTYGDGINNNSDMLIIQMIQLIAKYYDSNTLKFKNEYTIDNIEKRYGHRGCLLKHNGKVYMFIFGGLADPLQYKNDSYLLRIV